MQTLAMPVTFVTAQIETPIGYIEIRGNADGIGAIRFLDECPEQLYEHEALRACTDQLKEYFAGSRKSFHNFPLRFAATTFQEEVWNALMDVPYGEVVTYGDLAKRSGHAGAARAVGTAMNVNPLAIIIPCHRVVPSNHSIGEYASGAHRKMWLLEHEAAVSGL